MKPNDETKKPADEAETEEPESEEIPVCTNTTTAEHSRMDKIEQPCDDGRAGK